MTELPVLDPLVAELPVTTPFKFWDGKIWDRAWGAALGSWMTCAVLRQRAGESMDFWIDGAVVSNTVLTIALVSTGMNIGRWVTHRWRASERFRGALGKGGLFERLIVTVMVVPFMAIAALLFAFVGLFSMKKLGQVMTKTGANLSQYHW